MSSTVTLLQKTVSGVIWTGLAKLTMQGVLFIVTIVLARLLTPGDFGVIGMAAIVTVAVSMVNDRGLGTAIIQKKAFSKQHLDSLFWGSLGFGIVLLLGTSCLAFPVAYFFKLKIIAPVVIALSAGFVIGAFGIVQKSLLTREMAFKKLSLIEIGAVLLSGLASILLALANFGVWSLVVGMLMRDLVNVLVLWLVCPWKPKAHFAWREFRDFIGFSGNVLLNDLALYLNTNTDVMIIGRVLGSVLLGYYSLALNLVKLPVTRLSGVVAKVVFPAFSEVQDNLPRFRHGYLRSLTFISLVTFPILTGLALFAREFILVFLGEKWLQMTWPLIILTPMAMLKSIGTIKGSVLMARGKPNIELLWNLAYLLPLAGVVYLGTRWGLVGVAAAFTLLHALSFPIIQNITNRQIELDNRAFYRAFRPAFWATGVMVVTSVFLTRIVVIKVFNFSPLMVLIVGVTIAALSYVSYLWSMHKELLQQLFELITQKSQEKNLKSVNYAEGFIES